MNLENIKQLTSILTRTGFGDLQHRLIRYICCKPVQFVLVEQSGNGTDHLTYRLYFNRHNEDYRFSFYDASLVKRQSMPMLTINQVQLQSLEKIMQGIDWKAGQTDSPFRLDEEGSWKREQDIECIVNDLARLCVTADGKAYADMLKITFWSDTFMEEMTGSLAPVRSKLEVSQRFYISDGECITIEEATRFLQNRWIEKKMQLQRKSIVKSEGDEGSTGTTPFQKGLLKKKRKVRIKVK